MNNVKSMAIIDIRVGVSIVTKEIWEKWDKLALCKTRMTLQLADKKIMGILEDLKVMVCEIKIEHTFVVVIFELDTKGHLGVTIYASNISGARLGKDQPLTLP